MTHWLSTLRRLREAFWLLCCSPISIAHSLHSLYPTVAEVSAGANCTKTYEPGYTRWINNTRISTKLVSKVNSIKYFRTPWNYKGHYQAANYKTVQDITWMVMKLIWWARWKPAKFGMWYGIYWDSLTGWKGRLWPGSRTEKPSRRILWFQNRQRAIKYSHWLQEI